MPLIFVYHFSHFSWHKDVGYYVPPCIQQSSVRAIVSYYIPMSKVIFSFAKKREPAEGVSQWERTVFSARQIMQLRLRFSPSSGQGGFSSLAGPAPAVPAGTAQTFVWPCLTITLLMWQRKNRYSWGDLLKINWGDLLKISRKIEVGDGLATVCRITVS